MKKQTLAAVLSIMTASALLAGCGSSTASAGSTGEASAASSSSAAEIAEETAQDQAEPVEITEDTEYDGELNIMVILKTQSSEVGKYLEVGAENYELAHSNVHVDVVGATSETSYDEQLNSIETAITSGKYDALVLDPLQSEAAGTMLANSPIPVVSFDTSIAGDIAASHVGVGNTEAAKVGAIAAVEAAKNAGWEEINCIEIAGVQGDPTNEARMEGYIAGITEAGGTFLEDEIQYADAVADKAVNCMESIMSKFPEGVAIICANNDDMAIGAARAAAENEAYANTIFLGFDGMSSAAKVIVEGSVNNYLSVACDWTDMTYRAVDCAVRAVKGEELPAFVSTTYGVMDETNAQERLELMESYLN